MLDQIGLRYESIPLTQVLDRLYLGGFHDAEGLAKNNYLDITHVCNCTTEKLNLPRQRFRVIQMDQIDCHEWVPAKLYSAVDWIHQSLSSGGRVLVHCHAGVSRSPTLLACYLYTCGFDFNKAVSSLKHLRNVVEPHEVILASAKKAFGIK